MVPLNRKVPLNEGERVSPLLNLDHSPSQREYQVGEGEGTCLLLNLDISYRTGEIGKTIKLSEWFIN